ncbi:uncharacterized protein LOC116766973 [Danaus plexippus]|uniref:uncharacterized protein LOC116766973 n=1 Tax=Danaus plexippus TaxID=13037 RepID=UPI002AAF942F|nr:uncharacterized protein LOC116766973 [Danaus plexippus]
MKYILKLLDSINQCLIPKLAKNFDERENHPEFEIRNNTLDQNFKSLEQYLGDLDLPNTKGTATIIAALIILYKELDCECPWNGEKSKEYSKKLNIYFELVCGSRLDTILHENKNFNIQEIFNICLENLHSKLTYENFKKYPGQVEVYCWLAKDLRRFQVKVKPAQVFPAALLLIEDYININTSKGLICCLSILRCLKSGDYEGGNYYEVIYRSLNKTFIEKDADITKLTHACLLELCEIFPPIFKTQKLQEMYTGILDQLMTESNLYRKGECLSFAKSIIEMHKVNCISENTFKVIICDCLDICTNEVVADILLNKTLECLDEWIQYGWCVWRFSTDYRMISILFKVLYVCKDNSTALYIQKLIVTFITLCKPEEKKQILKSLENVNKISSVNFRNQVEAIKKEINI